MVDIVRLVGRVNNVLGVRQSPSLVGDTLAVHSQKTVEVPTIRSTE